MNTFGRIVVTGLLGSVALSCGDGSVDTAETVAPENRADALSMIPAGLSCLAPDIINQRQYSEGQAPPEPMSEIRKIVDRSGTVRFLVFPSSGEKGSQVFRIIEETDSGSIYTVYGPGERILQVENMDTYERWYTTGADAVSHPRAKFASQMGDFAKEECGR